MSTFEATTRNMSLAELYAYLWECPLDEDGFTWYKIDLLMQEIINTRSK